MKEFIRKILQEFLGIKPKVPKNTKTKELRGFITYDGGSEEVEDGIIIVDREEQEFFEELIKQMASSIKGHRKGKLKLVSANIDIH